MKKYIVNVFNWINKIVETTSWYNNFWGGVCKFWYFEKKYVKVINLGSNSSKNAFAYNHTQVQGLNMALGPQSLSHDYAILKNYFSYLDDNGVVIITLCPFSCLKVNYSKQHNFKYYTILHPATIHGFNEAERRKALLIQTNPFKAMPIKSCIAIAKDFYRQIVPRKSMQIDYVGHAIQMIDGWKKQFGILDLDSPMKPEHLRDFTERATLLREMIDFSRARGLRPYIIIPPVHKALSDRLSPTFLHTYVYNFVKTAGANDIFLNFLNDSSFQHDMFFQNSLYLNTLGADKFTNEVLTRLQLQ